MSAGLNVQRGVATTRFYTPGMLRGAVDRSAGNVPQPQQMAMDATNGTGSSGTLPALWWLGILIVIIALRVAYEMN